MKNTERNSEKSGSIWHALSLAREAEALGNEREQVDKIGKKVNDLSKNLSENDEKLCPVLNKENKENKEQTYVVPNEISTRVPDSITIPTNDLGTHTHFPISATNNDQNNELTNVQVARPIFVNSAGTRSPRRRCTFCHDYDHSRRVCRKLRRSLHFHRQPDPSLNRKYPHNYQPNINAKGYLY